MQAQCFRSRYRTLFGVPCFFGLPSSRIHPRALPAALGLIAFLVFGQASEGAVIFTISGDLNSPTATVTMSGFLTMQNVNTPSLTRNEFSTSGSGFRVLGNAPATSPFLTSAISLTSQIGPELDTALILIEDSSNGSATITTFQPDLLRYTDDGRFRITFPSQELYPTTIDAGDVATFSGSFDLTLESNFSSHFVPGTHLGSHQGEAVTIIVDAIPEPSTSLLLGMGVLLILRRRR